MRRPFFRLHGSALEPPSDEIPKGILIITISERLARFHVRKQYYFQGTEEQAGNRQ